MYRRPDVAPDLPRPDALPSPLDVDFDFDLVSLSGRKPTTVPASSTKARACGPWCEARCLGCVGVGAHQVVLDAGAEVWRRRADYDYWNWSRDTRTVDEAVSELFDTTAVALPPGSTATSANVSSRVRLASVVGDVGLRWDRIGRTAESDVSPRFGLAWNATAATTVRASWGIYRQAQGLDELQVEDGDRVFQSSERAQ